MNDRKYIPIKDLEVYQISRILSKMGWEIYDALNWQDKKIMGDQFIEATDSVGANITEGYHRFHYLDKIKFYYYSRASLAESYSHWLDLLFERKKISEDQFQNFTATSKQLEVKLNNFISATYNQSKQSRK